MIREQLVDALLATDRLRTREILRADIGKNEPVSLIEQLVVPAMEQIGAGWESGQVALSQVYMSGRIIEEIIDELLPPGDTRRKHQPAMAIAVLEDYHLLGKRVIYSAVRAAGYDLHDYGRMTVNEVVSAAVRDNIEMLLISALMLPSALRILDVRKQLETLRPELKIIAGGAPFRLDPGLWKEAGAHGTAVTAAQALALIEHISIA